MNKNESLPIKPKFFYGWIIVLLSALTLFLSGPGQTYSVSTFIDSFIDEFGWSRSLVSSMYSGGTLLAGLIMSAMGSFFDKHGHRKMTAIIGFSFGIVLIGMSFVNKLALLFVGFFFVRLLGQGSLSLASSTLVPQWFLRKRGTALSLVSMGGALSASTVPLINTWLIINYGWQTGWRFWGLVLIAVMVPTSLIFIRNKPEDVGLLPDDEKASEFTDDKSSSTTNSSLVKKISEINFNAKQVLKLKAFWIVLLCSMVPSALGTGMTFHMVSIMGENGLSPAIAASVLSIMALIRLPVILISGKLADKIPVKYLMAFSYFLLGLAMVILLRVDGVILGMSYGIIRGISMGVQAVTGGVVWPDYFGRKYLGTVRGIAMTGMVIGSAFGPLPFGFAYDIFGGYTEIIIATLLIPIVAGIAMIFVNKPNQDDLDKLAHLGDNLT
jgi:MFS family permease